MFPSNILEMLFLVYINKNTCILFKIQRIENWALDVEDDLVGCALNVNHKDREIQL